jgi:capsular polysaccharide export protein
MISPLPSLQRVATTSPGIARTPQIASLLGARVLLRPRAAVDAVVGWGRKPNTRSARALAERRGVPFLALEDGFVRSIGLGVEGAPPWSIVVDDVGIYYDATQPSRLELMLQESAELDDPALLERAQRCIGVMREARISKYNAAPVLDLGPKLRRRILVVDQTAGDLSLRLGLAPERGVVELVEAALREHPDAEIIVKTHPDVASGHKAGGEQSALEHPRVRLITAAANPIAVLEQVDEVYVMTSLLGFEALLMGLPVTCFGAPFYAGWGATADRVRVERRTARRSAEQIFAAAYLRYACYVDPVTGEAAELERVIEHIASQGRSAEAGVVVAVGFSLWKRGFLDAFLSGASTHVRYARDAADAERRSVPCGATFVVWGAHADAALEALAARYGGRIARMEDGFLRSVGLGSDLYAPASLVIDTRGIYYDPTRVSDLEHLLATRHFTEVEQARAATLRARIVRSGVSKYNADAVRTLRAAEAARAGRRVVLVVGQVEDDASIRLGCLDVRTNAELLREARRACPDAFLVWKPHPDVSSGNRHGAVAAALVETLADEVATDVAISACLSVAHEVHTMTSLVGFEALLREKDVVVYGQPFYAGWGLTRDRHPHPRRTRRVTLDELVHATLIDYPTYVDPGTEARTTPEAIVAHLEAARSAQGARGTSGLATSWPGRQARKLSNLARYALRSDPRTARLLQQASTLRPGLLAAAPSRGHALHPTLPDFGVSRALMLQGPAGPFFHRLGQELRDHGVSVTKVNLHAGDVIFYPGPDTLPYRGRLADFETWVAQQLRERTIDGVFLFGDCRAYHKAAIEAARAADVPVWVFEEGYLRPDWITYERDGVNGHSRMSRDPRVFVDAYRAAGSPPEPEVLPVGDTFSQGAWYSTANAIAYTLANQGYPHYEHHRNLNAFFQAKSWVVGAARKQYFARVEEGVLEDIVQRFDGRYFFVPLQVHCDFQIQHSPYGDVTDFIHEVVASFAQLAPRDHALVLKHHPMDRPFRDYTELFDALRREHGLEGRLFYIHDLHLPTLLKHARGTVTINSTVGLSGIHHRTPTKVMGNAIYDMPGLTHQGSLESMWQAPEPVDMETYHAFRWWLLQHNQANGNIMAKLKGVASPTGVAWRVPK